MAAGRVPEHASAGSLTSRPGLAREPCKFGELAGTRCA